MDDLYVYKYRPTTLNDIKYHDSAKILRDIKDPPNMIIYGSNGSGKKTILYAFLNQLFGLVNTNCIEKEFKINSKSIIIPYFYSNFHTEFSINDMSCHARTILPQIINSIAKTKSILTNSYKLIVIHDAELLDIHTQTMLRRIFEIYITNCRFILITKSLSKIIDPIQSRCLLIRVGMPQKDEIKQILQDICTEEKQSIMVDDCITENVKDSIFLLENKCKNLDIDINVLDTKIMKEICQSIKMNKINKTLYQKINDYLYVLLSKNISFSYVLEFILNEFLNTEHTLNPEDDVAIIELIAKYDHLIQNGARTYLHIQAFLSELIELTSSV